VKIEEGEYGKVNKKSKHIGVSYYERDSKWYVRRWSKNEKKVVANGCYDDEEKAAHASDTLARKLIKNGENQKLNFSDVATEVYPEEKSSKFIGVSYHKNNSKWYVQRWSSKENKSTYNGCYDDEKTAAHASDTIARKFMENGEQNQKLNFPNDHTEVYPEKEIASKFIGVTYNKNKPKWYVQRWSKYESKNVFGGCYDNEKTAAHASDTLARKLMKNGEQNHKLNFPEDHTEVYPEKEKESKYIGVSYNKKTSKWLAQRWSKDEKRVVSNGSYDDEETAAHASDILAKLTEKWRTETQTQFS